MSGLSGLERALAAMIVVFLVLLSLMVLRPTSAFKTNCVGHVMVIRGHNSVAGVLAPTDCPWKEKK